MRISSKSSSTETCNKCGKSIGVVTTEKSHKSFLNDSNASGVVWLVIRRRTCGYCSWKRSR